MSQATASENGAMTRTEVLVSPEWLAGRLDDPSVQVIEVDVNAKNYRAGHIPGALLWNVYQDFRKPDYGLVDEHGDREPVRPLGPDARHHRRLLRLRARPRVLDDEALPARRRAHPRQLA